MLTDEANQKLKRIAKKHYRNYSHEVISLIMNFDEED